MKRKIINVVLTLLVAVVLFYVTLPAIHLSNPSFYVYIGLLVLFYFVLDNITNENILLYINKKKTEKHLTSLFLPIGFLGFLAILFFIDFIFSPLFHASSYANRIEVNQEHDFALDIQEVEFDKISLLDKDSAQKLGKEEIGTKSEWASEYSVSNLYTQINYNDANLFVSPIDYNSFASWSNNKKDGIKGYMTVNGVSKEAKIISLEEGIKYTESAYFSDNLYRKLRFSYPTRIFGEANFELDDEGSPYWIVSTLKYTAIGLNPDVKSIIVLNAITGESKEYAAEDVPNWVDHVYAADLIVDQVNNWGKYKKGFINSIFSRENVVNATEGYNYLAINSDIFMYTGITNTNEKNSNLGFILTNVRTKETNYYAIEGVGETDAMDAVKSLAPKNEVSFPLLINIDDRATYLLNVKDSTGLIKMYALVDAVDSNNIVISDSTFGIEEAIKKYKNEYINYSTSLTLEEDTIVVKSIEQVLIRGNTNYYITDAKDKKYVADIEINKYKLPYLKEGQTISVVYAYLEADDIRVIKILK